MAADAQMKRSTWRYFQREKAFEARRKSTRPRGYQPRLKPRSGQRQRRGGQRDRVGVVGVNHFGTEPPEQARKTPGGVQIELAARRERVQVGSLRHPPAQLAAGVRDQRGAVALTAQAEDREQYLVLAAAPGPRGVDVDGEHDGRYRSRGSRCCSHSLANFRNT